MSQLKSNRRDLLALLGLGAGYSLTRSPLLLLVDVIIQDQVSQAFGQAAGARKWIDIFQPRAPARWVFDLMLTPYNGGPAYQPNSQVGTRYVASGGRYTDVEYATVRRFGMNVPHMWQFDVPRADGGMRPMSDLLRNFLSIRGVNTNNPGHSGSQQLHFLPLGLTQSIPALAGDASSAPLAGVYTNVPGYKFRSSNGKSAVQVSGNNLINSLLTPFLSAAPDAFKQGQNALRTHINVSKAALLAEAAVELPSAFQLRDAVRGADELILRSFGDLTATWTSLLDKYRALITRSLDRSIVLAGINDIQVGVAGTRTSKTYDIQGLGIANGDLRDLITATTAINSMASSFAIAEFVIINNLSSSMTVMLEQMTDISVNGQNVDPIFDEHDTGAMTSLYINTYYSRALSSCLLELIDRLKAASMFNDVVICNGGEFNRAPRNGGIGSDHGYHGQSLAFYSGCIGGPLVIGNVAANAPLNGHNGTWGYYADTGGKDLDLGHVAASIATMLGVPSPTKAKPSLVRFDSAGKVIAASDVPQAVLVA